MDKLPDKAPHEKASHDPTDAYIDWGFATDFRFVVTQEQVATKVRRVGLLIEWKTLEAAARAVEIVKESELEVADLYLRGLGGGPRRFWSLSIQVLDLKAFLDAVRSLAHRVELAAPIGAGAARVAQAKVLQSSRTTLAAVLDDGCAFANRRFVDSNGSTRVLWLWNQNPGAPGFPLSSAYGPSTNTNLAYGSHWPRDELDQLVTDEGSAEQAYAAAGLYGLRRAICHGAHMMDLLAGAEPQWDIVFVQFPRAGIDDPSGRWLNLFAFDALHYVVECAGANTKKIVVNLSWGTQTGPHDGSGVLERVIDDLVSTQADAGRQLYVCLPAGNSFGSRAHAVVPYRLGASLDWVVPPDGETPAFVEIWWPSTVPLQDIRFNIRPPGEASGVDVKPGTKAPDGTWYVKLKRVGAGAKALVVVHPTAARVAAWRGRHGRWLLTFERGPLPHHGDIHLYVARADHNMGARRRAKPSYLTDPALEKARFVAAEARFDEAPGSSVTHKGTLNGLATGTQSCVAGGYRLSDFESAPYASSGGSRGARTAPDFACATDRSLAVRGIRATGVRSGTSAALVGTSTAAPQYGRQLVNQQMVEVLPYPHYDPDRIGAACLMPDDGVIRPT